MKYEILVPDRKEVVRKIEEITGRKPRYTGMPEAAFVLDGIVIARDGTLTAGDEADTELIVQLIRERMIGVIPRSTGGGDSPDDEWPDDGEEAYSEEKIKPEISFPLDGHRRGSIANLACTVFSKGALISKATGGRFAASEGLVEKLLASDAGSREDAIRTIAETEGGLEGISFGEGRVTFDGFPETADPKEIQAWTQLAAAINGNAIEQKHVRAKESEPENEKYAFRTWLARIGMKGPDTKEARQILYRNLSGHTAFRTEEDREKWKARIRERKEAKRNGGGGEDAAV